MILVASMISLMSPLKYLTQKLLNRDLTGITFNFISLLFCVFYYFLSERYENGIMLFLSIAYLFSLDLKEKLNLEGIILPFLFVDIGIQYKSLLLLVYLYASKNKNILNFLSIILLVNNNLFLTEFTSLYNLILLSVLFFNNLVFNKEVDIVFKKLLYTFVLSGIFQSTGKIDFLVLSLFIFFSYFLYTQSRYKEKQNLALYVLPLSLYYLDKGSSPVFLLLILFSYNFDIKLPEKFKQPARDFILFLSAVVSFFIFVTYVNNYIYSLVLMFYLVVFMKSVIKELKNSDSYFYKILILLMVVLLGVLWK